MTGAVAAVDLGATSGRVMLGYVGSNELRLVPVSRFPNGPVDAGGELHWDATGLFDRAVEGLAAAAAQEPELASIGIDAWAVDYGLLRNGRMLGEPFHYRDSRTARGVAAVHERVSAADLYAATGLQHLPFNTVFQLADDQAAGRLDHADQFLLIPDLFAFWLTGAVGTERTNASTTGLFNTVTGQWDDALIRTLGLPRQLFAPLSDAGVSRGILTAPMAARMGAPRLTVTNVGSHDTASAVVAVPSVTSDFAYISCGTWSLVGVELERPVLTEASRLANFTNEGGVDGRVRYLRNVMGLWILTETLRGWGELSFAHLLQKAADYTGAVTIFDPDDARFLAPGDMPSRIAAWCGEHDRPFPESRAGLVRSILESLADAYLRTITEAQTLSGKRISVIHLVGGGSQNELLCQLTADRTGLPVLAGPVEATAIGNVLVQARALGLASGSLESLRSLVAATHPPRRFEPRLAAD